MVVILTSAVEGLSPGEEYTGPNETYYLENGYAKAVDPGDVPDLDHPTGVQYEHTDVEPDYEPTPSEQAYPEVSVETLIQSAQADEVLGRVRATKRPYSSDPAPEPAPEPEPEPDPEA